jgi:hypothetical protein
VLAARPDLVLGVRDLLPKPELRTAPPVADGSPAPQASTEGSPA